MVDQAELDLFARSGRIVSQSPAVAVLYTLLRDGDVKPGRLETVMDQILTHETPHPMGGKPYRRPLKPAEMSFSLANGWLAQYAADVIARLTVDPETP